MKKEIKPNICSPGETHVEFKEESQLRPDLQHLRKTFEEINSFARKRPGKNEKAEWGEWYYARGFGFGSLYLPFGDGVSSTFLACSGDIDNNDLSTSVFILSVAVWSQIRNGKSVRRAVIALPQDEWQTIRGAPQDELTRSYFFYTQPAGESLELSMFGSEINGWWTVENKGYNAMEQFTLEIGKLKMPAVLSYPKISECLQLFRKSERVNAPKISQFVD